MTIKNKIATSIVASAILATGAFSADGTLTYQDGSANAVIAEELYQLSGEYNASIMTNTNAWLYTPSIDESGTVSDATVNMTLSAAISKTAATDEFLIYDTEDNNTIAVESSYDAATGIVKFDSNGNVGFSNGKTYAIVVSDGGVAVEGTFTGADFGSATTINGSKTVHSGLTAQLDVWTGSGDDILEDTAVLDVFSVTPQYKVACDNKFNNLINVENASMTFVSTKHGALSAIDINSTSADLMDVLSDVMRFTVTKTAVDFGLDGNGSTLLVSADNNTSFLTSILAGNGSSNFADGAAGNAITINDMGSNYSDINVTDVTTAGPAASETFYGLGASVNTYTVNLAATGTNAIPATNFTANFYIWDNIVDTNTTYTPADTSYVADAKVGEWSEFAYIAQIGAVSYAPGITNVKFYVTNRSCKAVAPTVKLVRGGETLDVVMDTIAVDTQAKFTIDQVAAAAVAAGDTLPGASGPFAVEITLAGNAEDFYVAAQMDNGEKIKDLPVYNTSTRSY